MTGWWHVLPLEIFGKVNFLDLEFFSLKSCQFALRVHVEKCDNVMRVIYLFILQTLCVSTDKAPH